MSSATDPGVHILLVEDDEADAVLLQRFLEPLVDGTVQRARTLRSAVEAATRTRFDVVVLDLGLPDAWGLDTILRFNRLAPPVPVVVLTGTQAESFAERARRAGAVAFISKSVDVERMAAEVRAAIPARGLGGETSERELHDLSRVARPSRLAAAAAAFGADDVADVPELWGPLVDRYGDLLDLIVDQATFRSTGGVGDHLRDFVGDLASMGARPRDLISIHTAALRSRMAHAEGGGIDGLLAEARLAVLEAMGYLASHYRTRALGAAADGTSPEST